MVLKSCVAERAHKAEFRRNDVFHGFPYVCLLRGDVRMLVRGVFLSKAHRAASLAHVALGCSLQQDFFLRTVKPPTEIAFDSGASENIYPRLYSAHLVFLFLPCFR